MKNSKELSIYDFNATTINGEDISLSRYKGKVILIVNTASGCGFTPQYKGLEELFLKFGPDNFVVLGFPCNQFGNQEPGKNEEIKSFCELNYNVTFPLFSKIDVNGPNANPLYIYLKKEKRGLLGSDIKWNFTKFLINKEGKVVKRFAPVVKPEKIEDFVAKLVKE